MSWLDLVAKRPKATLPRLPQAWEIAGEDTYSCIPPPGYEPDPAVLAALHEFDPEAILAWRITPWLAPGIDHVVNVIHVGIMRYMPSPLYLRRHFQVLMPTDAQHPTPNFLDVFFAGEQIAFPGPKAYVPFDWECFTWCRKEYARLTLQQFDEDTERIQAEKKRRHDAWKEELEYRKKQLEPYLLRKAETISEADWERYQAAQRVGVRRAGLRQPKPFIHVRGVAPSALSDSGSPPPKE